MAILGTEIVSLPWKINSPIEVYSTDAQIFMQG